MMIEMIKELKESYSSYIEGEKSHLNLSAKLNLEGKKVEISSLKSLISQGEKILEDIETVF